MSLVVRSSRCLAVVILSVLVFPLVPSGSVVGGPHEPPTAAHCHPQCIDESQPYMQPPLYLDALSEPGNSHCKIPFEELCEVIDGVAGGGLDAYNNATIICPEEETAPCLGGVVFEDVPAGDYAVFIDDDFVDPVSGAYQVFDAAGEKSTGVVRFCGSTELFSTVPQSATIRVWVDSAGWDVLNGHCFSVLLSPGLSGQVHLGRL